LLFRESVKIVTGFPDGYARAPAFPSCHSRDLDLDLDLDLDFDRRGERPPPLDASPSPPPRPSFAEISAARRAATPAASAFGGSGSRTWVSLSIFNSASRLGGGGGRGFPSNVGGSNARSVFWAPAPKPIARMVPFGFVLVMKALEGTRFGVLAISTLIARSPRIMPLSFSAAVASAFAANSTKANCPPLPATRASSTAPHTENVARRCSTPIPVPRLRRRTCHRRGPRDRARRLQASPRRSTRT